MKNYHMKIFLPLIFLFLLISGCNIIQHEPAPDTSIEKITPAVRQNCGIGCPLGGSNTTIYREVYTLNNNSNTKFANWVAYLITIDSIASGKQRNWKKDPDLSNDETLSPADYIGANKVLKVDRGHQAPLASLAGLVDLPALNYLSNITPQAAELNQGPWARLEDQERVLAKAGNKVFSVTGPLYEKNIGKLPNSDKNHFIPSGYWKVTYINESPEKSSYAAFIMEQNTSQSRSFCQYQVTVKEIEQRTGLIMWSRLPANIQLAIKSTPGKLVEKMGCSIIQLRY
ncbi:MAG: DNA/RNA non-specific endonuclease [Arsenophonus sp.]|nr:DNA/RNA non-specific endonuclease [Arsenophonus sp.]MDR5617566.1 DNA/RNA non-specific endonuclease [Arsenophonus sp.]